MSGFFVLEARADRCDVEVYLNGVPITRRGPSHGRSFGAPVNHYVIDGINELALVIGPGARPSEALAPSAGRRFVDASGCRATARLSRYPAGAVIGGPDAVELMRVDYTPPASGRAVAMPRVIECREDLGARVGRWSWQDAPRITLDEATRGEIASCLEGLARSLNAGETDVFLKLSAVRLEDIARAFERPIGEKTSVIRNGQAGRRLRPDFAVKTVPANAFDLRLCAADRMVECIADDWRAIVREAPSAETMFFPMTLSMIGGAWSIVR